MHPLVIIFTSVVFIHGASCTFLQKAAMELFPSGNNGKGYIRQTNSQLQCVEDWLDNHFQGNTSQIVTRCKSAATEEIDISDPFLQDEINRLFSVYCIPDCGDAINNANNDCGIYDDALDGTEELNIGLCGTNSNGEKCYLLYDRARELLTDEVACYNNYISTNLCTCRSELEDGVEEQGCCLENYHTFLSGLNSDYNPSNLYRSCNVDFPQGCNNSPITASSFEPLIAGFTTLMTAVTFSLLI